MPASSLHASKIPFSTETWQSYVYVNSLKLYAVQNVPVLENKVLLRVAFSYKIEVIFEGFSQTETGSATINSQSNLIFSKKPLVPQCHSSNY